MLLKDLKIMILEKKQIFRVGSETGSGTFLTVGSGSVTLWKVGSGSGSVTKSFGSTTLYLTEDKRSGSAKKSKCISDGKMQNTSSQSVLLARWL
jgi:hypothetical protein